MNARQWREFLAKPVKPAEVLPEPGYRCALEIVRGCSEGRLRRSPFAEFCRRRLARVTAHRLDARVEEMLRSGQTAVRQRQQQLQRGLPAGLPHQAADWLAQQKHEHDEGNE